MGFHGYAEDAELQMERLRATAGNSGWLCVSIQALHRFYRGRTERVGASWMTGQDRLLAIADNIAYVKSCLDAVRTEWPECADLPGIFAGFSQGVAMAFRAAVHAASQGSGVIAVGGDIPPEINTQELTRVSKVLLIRGTTDDWYTQEKFATDQHRLRESGVPFRAQELTGGHEWSADVTAVAAEFLGS